MGFLPQTEWTKQRAPDAGVPECGKCGLHKKCKSPFMKHEGRGSRKVLILGEGPGYYEDQQGRALAGNEGTELARILWEQGIDLRRDCWYDNAIVCRAAHPDGKGREPTGEEMRYCRPRVRALIEKLQPEVIIPLGIHAVRSVCTLAWKDDLTEFPTDGGMQKWSGWQIPSIKLNSWICPNYPTSWLLHKKNDRSMAERNAYAPVYVADNFRAAFALKGRPHRTPPDYRKKVEVVLDPQAAARAVRAFTAANKPTAWDIESDRLKPDPQDSKILCCALSDGVRTVAFPWHGEAVKACDEFFRSNCPKIGANIGGMEERWVWRHLGHGVRNWWWDCNLGAHWLDCQGGITGVKFQAFVLLGVEDYSYFLDDLIGSSEPNKPNRLNEVGISDLCRYCGLDALLEYLICFKQREAYDAQAV